MRHVTLVDVIGQAIVEVLLLQVQPTVLVGGLGQAEHILLLTDGLRV